MSAGRHREQEEGLGIRCTLQGHKSSHPLPPTGPNRPSAMSLSLGYSIDEVSILTTPVTSEKATSWQANFRGSSESQTMTLIFPSVASFPIPILPCARWHPSNEDAAGNKATISFSATEHFLKWESRKQTANTQGDKDAR